MTSPNLLQINQANVEYDTSGFSGAAGGSTLSRDTTEHQFGAASLKVVTDGVNQFQGFSARINTPQILTPGGSYTISLYLKGSGTCRLILNRDSGGHIGGQVNITLTSTWTRYSITNTLPNPITNVWIGIQVDTNSTNQATTFWADGLQFEAGSSATTFQLPDPVMMPAGGASAASLIPSGPPRGSAALSGGATATLSPQLLRGITPNGLTVLLAGQDISDYVDEPSMNIDLVLAQGAGVGGGGSASTPSVTLDVYLGPAAKAIGAGQTPSGTDLVRQGEIQVFDATGTQVFGGFVTKLDDKTDSINVMTTLTCDDYWGALDRVQSFKLYTGQGDVDIIKDLLTTYAPWVDQSQLPSANSYVWDVFPGKGSVKELIQKIADSVGWGVWIDSAKVIHYVSLSTAQTAPFGVAQDPDYITTFSHAVTKYEQDDTAIVNRVYFYGGKNVSPDFTQDLSVQANGSNKTFALLYFPHESSDNVIHLKKNGVDLVMYSVFDTTAGHELISAGGTADALINKDSKVIIFDTAPLATDTLTVTYRYNTPLVIVMESQTSHDFFGDWYDARISDSSVYDTNTALQRCRALLAEQDFGLETLEFTCWQPGLYPGQIVHVTNDTRGIDKSYLIQEVKITSLGSGFFQYDVSVGAWNWSLMDVLVQNARILNPTDSSSEEDLTVIQAKESAEAATVVVVFTKTTRTSGAYYSRTSAVGDGHDAYSGFFSVTG